MSRIAECRQLLSKGKFKEVVDKIDIELMKGKTDLNYYLLRGIAYLRLENKEKAKNDLLQVLSRDENNLNALASLFELSAASDDMKGAVYYLGRVIDIKKSMNKPVLAEYKKLVKLFELTNDEANCFATLCKVYQSLPADSKDREPILKKLGRYISQFSYLSSDTAIILYDTLSEMKRNALKSMKSSDVLKAMTVLADYVVSCVNLNSDLRLFESLQDLYKDTPGESISINARLQIAHYDPFYMSFKHRTELAERGFSLSDGDRYLPFILLYSPSAQLASVNSEKTRAKVLEELAMFSSCPAYLVSYQTYEYKKREDVVAAREYLDIAIKSAPQANTKDIQAMHLSQCYLLMDNYDFELAASLVDELNISDETKLEIRCLILLYEKKYSKAVSLLEEKGRSSDALNEYYAVACLFDKQWEKVEKLAEVLPNQNVVYFLIQAITILEKEQDSTNTVIKALQSLASGLQILQKAVKHGSDDQKQRYLYMLFLQIIGDCYMDRLHDLRRAANTYKKLVNECRTYLPALRRSVEMYMQLENYSTVVEQCTSIAVSSPVDSLLLFAHRSIAVALFYMEKYSEACVHFQKLITLCVSLLTRYSEDELQNRFDDESLSLCNYLAVCKYYKAECECYFDMFKLGAALRVADQVLDLFKETWGIDASSVTSFDDEKSRLFFDMILLKSEILANSIHYSENLSLLEPFCKLQITYHRSIFLFHLARVYYQLSFELVGEGRTDYAYKLIQQALETVADAYYEVGNSSAILELKVKILRLKQTLLASFLNMDESEELQKQLRLANQQRLFLDPTDVQLWCDHLSDESIFIQSKTPNFIIEPEMKHPEPSTTISFRHSIILNMIQHMLKKLLHSKTGYENEVRVNCLSSLWQALARTDPRLPVKERALLECMELQKHWRTLIHSDVALPYAMYAVILMSHNKPNEAMEAIRKGRSLISNNLTLMFLESYCNYYYLGQKDAALQMAETCCLVSTVPESAAMLLLLQLGNKQGKQTEQLVLKCANLLLSSKDPKILLLCAKAFFRCRLYRKCLDVLDRIDVKADITMKTTVDDLRHFATQYKEEHESLSSMKLPQNSPTYFTKEGGIDHLLQGKIQETDLLTEKYHLEMAFIEGKNSKAQALNLLYAHPYDILYHYFFYISLCKPIFNNEKGSLPSSTVFEFGNSTLKNLIDSFDNYSVWSSSNPYLRQHYIDILSTVLRFQTFFSLRNGGNGETACKDRSAEMATVVDPTNLQVWELLAMKSLDDYMKATLDEKEMIERLNVVRRLFVYVAEHEPEGTFNSVLFRLYEHLLLGESAEHVATANQIKMYPELAFCMKQAFIFGKELKGAAKDGGIEDVKEVLKINRELAKSSGLSTDVVYRLKLEIALIFYRTKNYEFCLKYLDSERKAMFGEGWHILARDYITLLCQKELGRVNEMKAFASQLGENPMKDVYERIFKQLGINIESYYVSYTK